MKGIICCNINPLFGIQGDTKIHVSVNFKLYIQLFKSSLKKEIKNARFILSD